MHRRRLASIVRQLRGEHHEPAAAVPAAADLSAEAEEHGSVALDAAQQQHVFEFVTRGVTVVGPEEHGLPTDLHSTIWDNLKGAAAHPANRSAAPSSHDDRDGSHASWAPMTIMIVMAIVIAPSSHGDRVVLQPARAAMARARA